MYLTKEKLEHINTITHEGKVVILATDADGKIWYSVKQDGFEDSYLNTPPDERTGWENWQELELPNEADDQSVIDQQTAELTDAANPSSFVLRSCYKTFDQTAVAPVQLVSALGHVYVFRQSKTNTLLVDRFVLDGMTNKLNRKLEVRFKRSRQKHEASKSMKKGASGLVNIDTLDFRDINGNFFYEPTTELSLVNNLQNGWFSVVLVPTIENDVYRWHIFAYNSQSQKVELTTLLMSDEGLFDVQDYTTFEEASDQIIPRSVPGIIKRTLDLGNLTVANGLNATRYDVQREQQTEDGMQLLRDSTKVMLAIPMNTGNVAAFSFAVAADGTLSQISPTATEKTWRNTARQVLLPLNTLDNVKTIGTTTPPPQGQITRLERGEEDGVNIVSSTVTNLDATKINQVEISGTQNYNSFQQSITKIDDNVFEVTPPSPVLGNWEVIPEAETGLIFNGAVTACEITSTGKVRITAENHGLNTGEAVQIVDTRDYNGTYTVKKIDDRTFTLDDVKWQTGTAVNLKMESMKRRGLVFDGANDYVTLADNPDLHITSYTVEVWIKPDNPVANWQGIIGKPGRNFNIWLNNNGYIHHRFHTSSSTNAGAPDTPNGSISWNQWNHVAITNDGTTAKTYINGKLIVQGPTGDSLIVDKTPLYIGCLEYQSRKYCFKGQIAAARIWKVARTEEQIRDSMYLQLTGKELGLVGYWRLGVVVEEEKERRVLDFSVNGNDAVVYGGAYVSAISLSRNLPGTTNPAVKYENEEVFAVSQGATYSEQFEFKVNPAVDPNNVDGQGGQIFAITYKGKNNRSSLDWINITPSDTELVDIGGGWYQAKCRFTVPEGVSLVRSFGIGNIQGSWTTLDIRKQTIQLISDVITEAQYTDTVNLATLADNQYPLEGKVTLLEVKEEQEGLLLVEKRDLESQIAAIVAQEKIAATELPKLISAKKNEISNQESLINSLDIQLNQCYQNYFAELDNLFNYWCKIVSRAWGEKWTAYLDLFTEGMACTDRIADKSIDFKFEAVDSDYYRIVSSYGDRALKIPVVGEPTKGVLNPDMSSPNYHWKLEKRPDGYWMIRSRQDNNNVVDFYCGHDGRIGIWPAHYDWNQQWIILKNGGTCNNNIANAKQALDNKRIELKRAQERLTQLQNELKILETPSTDLAAQKTELQNRLDKVIAELTTIQGEINTLNNDFLNGVRTIQQIPQTMPQIAQDANGLVTQAALLGFVRPASGLSVLETCEGNVQLSYFDKQGRMRRTNYDATADSMNTSFEQWIPNALRPCLNFNSGGSVVKLNQALALTPDWSIEAWFCYPLATISQWNTLIRGQSADHHIIVKNGAELGIYLTNDPLQQKFYPIDFNLKELSPGWHHLTVVGKGNTTRFYIDGKEVGDTKAKALVDAQINLSVDPNNDALKQKLEDIKQATLKSTSDVYAIGNYQGGGQQFGKVTEVRIWGFALNDEEIEAHSKTLISGNESGLLAYYPLNEANGTQIRDHSGNGYNGTVSNPLWWACAAPIGELSQTQPSNQVMQFDGVNDHISLPAMNLNYSQGLTVECWVRYDSFKNWSRIIDFGNGAGVDNIIVCNMRTSNTLFFSVRQGNVQKYIQSDGCLELGKWMHIAVTLDASGSCNIYKNGQLIQSGTCHLPNNLNRTLNYIGKSNWANEDNFFDGQMTEFRLWNRSRTAGEIDLDMNKRLTGNEPGLAIYLPMSEISSNQVLDRVGTNHGTVTEATIIEDNTIPLRAIGSSLVSAEYSTMTINPMTGQKTSLMRRLFAAPAVDGINLLRDKPLETLELTWIGNAQFAPTLLGYIEGAPPVPTENLTLADDYNGATSVELTMTEDVEFNWTRSQDSGLGATLETFMGGGGTTSVGIGAEIEVTTKAGYKGNLDFSYQFQNESSITSSSSLSMTDKLELRGTFEDNPKFPHLGNRFIPKNIGYALVVSALADVFVTRLARSKKMVGYQVLPVDGIPPDVNTITFLMNPAYTMNGSLDGMTGSSATSQRFFKHVPEMRSQYGSLYPASYYRLQEAYDLKRQIEAEDKRRESYFSNFDVRTVDETALDREINSGDAPSTIGVQREEDKATTETTAEEQEANVQKFQAESAATSQETSVATKAKQAEIQSKITDQNQQVHAMASFAGWQRNMENIQIRAGKRNIVNTYVWDADGGLRTEAQSFANTVEHTIGGSFGMTAGLGGGYEYEGGAVVELTAQATVNLTQTMSKTESRSKGFELNIDLSGMENKGVTNYNDNPILPGEKVDRYRFMSFYLEGSTQNFQDFFNYVVDPEWLRSNDEEARALRQTQAGKPNKTWRVLHRVTYVERPAMMGFGRDVRQLKVRDENVGIGKVIVDVASLQQKVDQILEWINSQKQ